MEFSSFWREIQLNLERAGETNGEFVTHTIRLGYAVMLIWREFLEISSFWREFQLNLERPGETKNGELES